MKFGSDSEKKDDVMFFESFPFVSHLAAQVYVNDDVGADRVGSGMRRNVVT